MASKDFNKAFAAARKEMGAGKTFMYNGKSYSTNIAGEGKSKPKGFSVDMAKSAIDKAAGVKKPTASTPRPKARPVDKTPKPVAAPAKITTSKIDSPTTASNKTKEQIIIDRNRKQIEAWRVAEKNRKMKPPIGKGGR